MSEPIELEGFITRLDTTDADGTERVTCLLLNALPTSSDKAKRLHELFGKVGSLPNRLRITIEEIT